MYGVDRHMKMVGLEKNKVDDEHLDDHLCRVRCLVEPGENKEKDQNLSLSF